MYNEFIFKDFYLFFLFFNIKLIYFLTRDQSWAESQKMGSFLSVSRGSLEPLRFLELSYENAGDESLPPIALVGKGITFDS